MAAVLRLVLMFLAFSHLIISPNAIPITRVGRLMHDPQNQIIEIGDTETTQLVAVENKNVERRMIVQLNDYAGSGANHRHTPWPPQPARCADC